jgi:hypothetical protein
VTPRQYKSLAKYLREMANHIGLHDWTITVIHEDPEHDTALASVECVYGRRIANVRVCHDFDVHPPEEQRTACLHELLHVHFWATHQTVLDMTGYLGSEGREIARDAWRQNQEHAIDAVAEAFSDHFPVWVP